MKKTSIGGEALIEGVMMRGPQDIAIAIRKSDGEVVIEKKSLQTLGKRYKVLRLPIIRGAVGLAESMVLGVKALMHSAEFVEIEEEASTNSKPSFFERVFGKERMERWNRFFQEKLGEKLEELMIYFSVIVALFMAAGLFIFLPNFIAGFIPFDQNTRGGIIGYNLFEGVIRIILFFGYIILISRMKDIQRVFQYHGAEHKTIHCYEHEEELTVENVRRHSKHHPRCGTAFLFVVMIISILVFSMVKWHANVMVNVGFRLLLMPLVAGISYEIIKFAGRSTSRFMQFVSMPGLALQHFTTNEPDDSQIEVAIAALQNVLVEDTNADKW